MEMFLQESISSSLISFDLEGDGLARVFSED